MRMRAAIPVVEQADVTERLVATEAELSSERMTNELLRENYDQIQLMLEDRGWSPLGTSDQDLSADGRARARSLTRYMSVTHSLIKRGLTLRSAYVMGMGVTITCKATGKDRNGNQRGQDVNAVVQAWLEGNKATFSGPKARSRQEWVLGTDGELFESGVTDAVTGKVTMGVILPEEIDDILTDPDNRLTPWYFLRSYTGRELMPDGVVRAVKKHVAYPAVGYRLRQYPDSIRTRSTIYAMQPDTFVRLTAVNEPVGSLRGIGDAFASLPWARAHKEFLEQWALLMRALNRFAWRHKTPPGKARQAAADAATAAQNYSPGATHVESAGYDLQAIPKTGATIDADSGKPLASYVGAGMGIPVTILLGDPGLTGARAVAETMDQPQELEFGSRRDLHGERYDDWAQHVIDSAVIAPQGALRGRILYDRSTGRVSVELPDEDDRTVDVTWPKYASTPLDVLVTAIATVANAPDIPLPPLVLARLALEAFGVEDIDEALADIEAELARAATVVPVIPSPQTVPADDSEGNAA